MTPEPAGSKKAGLEGEESLRRVLGRVVGEKPGPVAVCIGGIHGNEPAGIQALNRVFRTLDERCPPVHGEIVGLAGNLSALARRRRYIDKDLNRQWLPERLASLKSKTNSDRPVPEDREQHELLDELDRVFVRAASDVFILDLHSTSGESVPFIVMRDEPRNRSFAIRFHVPLVLGLNEHLEGTLNDYFSSLGHAALAFEAGQHDDAAAVDYAEAAIWTALAAAGNVDGALPEVRQAHEKLAKIGRSLPRVVEVRYRHHVDRGDRFQMEPGFANFQPITPGQTLGRDGRGVIRSRWRGRILMPLYQELGEDGFFIVREHRYKETSLP